VSPDFARVLMQIIRRAVGQSSKKEQGQSVTHPTQEGQNEGFTPIWKEVAVKTRRDLLTRASLFVPTYTYLRLFNERSGPSIDSRDGWARFYNLLSETATICSMESLQSAHYDLWRTYGIYV
jgi:hypothetical protein